MNSIRRTINKRLYQVLLAHVFNGSKGYATSLTTPKLTLLSNRSLVKVGGRDSAKLLQGLVTNDVTLLNDSHNGVLYSMLLNPNGRVLYDLFIYKMNCDNEFLLECDASHASDLISLMKRYKLRSKVKFELEEDLKIYTLFNDVHDIPITNDLKMVCKDPRLQELGYRLLMENDELLKLKNELDMTETPVIDYSKFRYKLGIAEGNDEISNAIPLELNIALLNGVSFTKGCYIGQELVARAHHTGVIRKRVMPLGFSSDGVQTGDTVLNQAGKRVGKILATENKVGIGLLRLKEALNSDSSFHVTSNVNENVDVTVHTPHWWPKDLKY